MWTEAHRARHEPGLKELVAACAVEEVAAWLERGWVQDTCKKWSQA
jgi:hypothetical protein